MENKYFDRLKKNIENFDRFKDILIPEHTLLTNSLIHAINLSGSISSFFEFNLIDYCEYRELNTRINEIIKKLKPLFEVRAKWTAERLEDFLGQDACTYRVILNTYNDLLECVFGGEKFDFIEVRKDSKGV